MQQPMKKTDFINSVVQTLLEFAPKTPIQIISTTKEPVDRNLHEIYAQFKSIIKEDINEVDFSKKIRGVFYEYAQGVESTVPETEDPVRNPDATIQTGQNTEEVGKAIKDLGTKVKQIKAKPRPAVQTSTVPASTAEPTLQEYVEENILPTVVEIIKQAERPRATKKALMEMFKLSPTIK